MSALSRRGCLASTLQTLESFVAKDRVIAKNFYFVLLRTDYHGHVLDFSQFGERQFP